MSKPRPQHVHSPALRVFLLGLALSVIIFCAGLLTVMGMHAS